MSEKTNIATLDYLNEYDPAIGNAMTDELKRQRRNLELIASENIVSPAVMAAMGSLLTNKYAEGYPGKRYLKKLPVSVRVSFSVLNTQMFSLTQVLRLTQRYILQCLIKVIR